MGIRSIFVMTHDSIGLGEDGPTHQPVEHLAALRAIPNHLVFRPADAAETAECWQVAHRIGKGAVDPGADPPEPARRAHRIRRGKPVRQGRLRTRRRRRRCGRSRSSPPARRSRSRSTRATLLQKHGTSDPRRLGALLRAVREAGQGLPRQDASATRRSRSPSKPRIRLGWDRFIGTDGVFIGMTGFGASAPAEELYPYFGITAEAVAEVARERVKNGVPQGRGRARHARQRAGAPASLKARWQPCSPGRTVD